MAVKRALGQLTRAVYVRFFKVMVELQKRGRN